jgi:ribulose bisphosphate carboxylase small subunit
MSRDIILETEEEGEADYAGRVRAVLDDGALLIHHEYFSPENKRWQSWHDAGAMVSQEGVEKLRKFLNEQ